MKKIILLAILFLMVSTAYAFTDILSVTNITSAQHTGFTLSGIALCYEAGDLIYCGYNGDDPNNLYIYNPTTEIWSNTSSEFATSIYYENHACEEYDGDSYVYCASKNWAGDTTFSMLRMDDDGNNVLNLNITNEPESLVIAQYSCEIRPGTDEFWCVTRGQSSNQLYLGYYDISDDIYTFVVSDIRPQSRIDASWNDYGQGCTWDETGENYYCSGGSNQDGITEANRTEALTIYNVATNTTTYKDMPVIASDGEFGFAQHSRVIDDTLWMYGFETSQWGELVDTIVYYDIDADTSAISGTSFVTEYTAELGGCVQYNESTDYCLFGYQDDPDWNEFADVWRLDFNYTPCVENWQPYYTACTIGDNQTLLYNDTNACGTTEDLPGDNGTVSSCNYCTLQYHFEETGCIDYENTNFPQYDNYGSCCAVTGIAEDCDLPANQSAGSCVGIHSSEDVSGITIDFLVEGAIVLLTLAGLIVVLVIGVWIVSKYRFWS